MIEGLQRFVRIKSLLQDTQRIDSHTISLVVAECDMALTTPATSPVFSEWWETQGQSMQQHASESPAEFARRLAAHAWTEATRAAQQATPEPVGEVALLVAEILSLADEYAEAEAKAGGLAGCGGDIGQQHELDEDAAYIKGRLTGAVNKLSALATRPAAAQTRSPIEALAISQVQQLINKLHEIAVEFHDSSTLRTRITREVTPLTASAPEPAINTIVAHLLYRRVNEACYEATLIGSPMGSVNALRIKLHVLRDELHEAIAKTAKTRTPA